MSQSANSQDLIYGDMGGTLVFIPRSDAEERVQLWRALERAKTWGEFLDRIPAGWRSYMDDVIVDLQDEWDEGPDEQPFNPSDIPGYDDGDWPPYPTELALAWMPDEMRQQLGEVGSSMTGGDHLFLDPAKQTEIVAVLEAKGYTCVEDQQMIEQVYGG